MIQHCKTSSNSNIHRTFSPVQPPSSDAVAGTTTLTGPGMSTLTAVRETQVRKDVQFLSPVAPLYQER